MNSSFVIIGTDNKLWLLILMWHVVGPRNSIWGNKDVIHENMFPPTSSQYSNSCWSPSKSTSLLNEPNSLTGPETDLGGSTFLFTGKGGIRIDRSDKTQPVRHGVKRRSNSRAEEK